MGPGRGWVISSWNRLYIYACYQILSISRLYRRVLRDYPVCAPTARPITNAFEIVDLDQMSSLLRETMSTLRHSSFARFDQIRSMNSKR